MFCYSVAIILFHHWRHVQGVFVIVPLGQIREGDVVLVVIVNVSRAERVVVEVL